MRQVQVMTAIFDLIASNKVPLALAWLFVLLLLERFFPAATIPESLAGYKKKWWKRWGRNFGLAGLNAFLSRFFVIPVTVIVASQPLWQRPDLGWAGTILDVILLDLWIYWWHRANHEISFFWRFHQIHHRDEFLDASTAFRFHLGEIFFSAIVRGAVILLLAIPIESVFLFEAFLLLAALFQHSNWRLWPRLEQALNKVIVTPSFHWLHHHAIREDTDSRYGTIFSFWDRLFGTLNAHRRSPFMPIGMPGGKEMSIWGLLRKPLI